MARGQHHSQGDVGPAWANTQHYKFGRANHRGVSPSPGPYIITLVSSRVKFCPANLPATKAHMTSDYVSYVLGLQGWERALNEDNYYVYSCMAGEEDVT